MKHKRIHLLSIYICTGKGGRKWLLAVAGFQELSYIKKMSRILLPNHCIFAADHI